MLKLEKKNNGFLPCSLNPVHGLLIPSEAHQAPFKTLLAGSPILDPPTTLHGYPRVQDTKALQLCSCFHSRSPLDEPSYLSLYEASHPSSVNPYVMSLSNVYEKCNKNYNYEMRVGLVRFFFKKKSHSYYRIRMDSSE